MEALRQVTRRVRARAITRRTAHVPTVKKSATKSGAPVVRATQPVAGTNAGSTVASVLSEIVLRADRGQLAEAIDAGERAVREGFASAELLSLVGTLHASASQLDRAEACYRKALFLEPTHEDALLHLALLLEKRGECALASKLRSRARRALSFHTAAGP